MRMCDLYIQTDDSVVGYWFAGDLDPHVNDALGEYDFEKAVKKRKFWKSFMENFSYVVFLGKIYRHRKIIEKFWKIFENFFF